MRGAIFHTADIQNSSKYRYIRYFSPVNGYCNVAEIEFYDKNGNKLAGTPVGSSGVKPISAFDGNLTTFIEAVYGSNEWIGLDLGTSALIGKIRFYPRTMVNSIIEGHTYELFYWDGQKWDSHGIQIASCHQLYYKASSDALFYLQDKTNNKVGSNFYMQDGLQKWL